MPTFMLVNEDELENKYNEKIETIEVMSDKPYYAIAHAGKAPAIIHFPRQPNRPTAQPTPWFPQSREIKM